MTQTKRELELEAEIAELRNQVFELFHQACYDGKYNHRHLSIYEETQEDLIRWGLVTPGQCTYKV